ncbi:hypothetical protein [Nocardia wallacei]|uniref:hypothetical protein n=1 Tax=Nocardia wallacei TaxID=480035 RepID=UPI002458A023|nr:hypothetical protein [Nocardia wallacei]
MNLTLGQRVRIQGTDCDGPFQATMTITHPGNATGWIGVGFPYGAGTTFMWIRPDQVHTTL